MTHDIQDTSLDAYASVDHQTVEARVLRHLRTVLDGTREEISFATGIKLQTVCGTVKPLLDRGALAITGKRPTTSGRDAQVLCYVREPGELATREPTLNERKIALADAMLALDAEENGEKPAMVYRLIELRLQIRELVEGLR